MATTITLTTTKPNGATVVENLVIHNDAKALAIIEAFARASGMDTTKESPRMILSFALRQMWRYARTVAQERRRSEITTAVDAQIASDFSEE